MFDECYNRIAVTKKHLSQENLTFSCEALIADNCPANFQRYSDLAQPESVLERSKNCDIEWPQFSHVSQEELEFPLAYVITAFTDARFVFKRNILGYSL